MDWNDLKVSSTVHLSNNSVINLFKLSRDYPTEYLQNNNHSNNNLSNNNLSNNNLSNNKFSINKIWEKNLDKCLSNVKPLSYEKIFENEFFNSSFVNFQKDLQLWDRDKLTVIDIITKRLRSTLHSIQTQHHRSSDQSTQQGIQTQQLGIQAIGVRGLDVSSVQSNLRSPDEINGPDVDLGLENELLISWLDKYMSELSNLTSEGYKIFIENAVKLLKKVDLSPVNFLNFMLNIVKLAAAKPQNFFYKYLKLSLTQLEKQAFSNLHYYILNTKQLFLNDLILNTQLSPLDTIKLVINTSNNIYSTTTDTTMDRMSDTIGHSGNRFTNGKPLEYYFFILYLLFRSGSQSSLNLLFTYLDRGTGVGMRGTGVGMDGIGLSVHEVPPLFKELCQILSNILLEKFDNTNQLALFLTTYPQSNCSISNSLIPVTSDSLASNPVNSTLVTSVNTVNSVNSVNNVNMVIWLEILLTIVFPENYVECDVSSLTREDYLWYKLRLMLHNSGTSLVVKSYELCKSLTQESNIDATDKDLVDRIVSYAYSIALSGGLMESLRLLMSAVKVPQVQSIAIFFTVLGEHCGVFDFEEVNFVSYALWNFVDENNQLVKSHTSEELSYLLLLAFNRNRNVSPELKILLSTLLPVSKNMLGVKYCVSENFNDAVSPTYLGSSITKDGMLLVGPLLQKLIKLSARRNAAKYAMLLLAQYCAYVGLYASAFKCFYCIQDTDNCAAVLEACCCYLYDKDDAKKTFNIDDLLVYYTLTKNLSPGNKHVLELRKTFSCIELCVLVKNNKYFEAVSYCKKHKVFDNSLLILRNESHQIYFNALFAYIKALKLLISTGSQPLELMNVNDASNLLDLLEAAYQNPNTDRKLTVEALHTLLTFISINPTK